MTVEVPAFLVVAVRALAGLVVGALAVTVVARATASSKGKSIIASVVIILGCWALGAGIVGILGAIIGAVTQ